MKYFSYVTSNVNVGWVPDLVTGTKFPENSKYIGFPSKNLTAVEWATSE